MDLPKNKFKQALLAGEIQYGLWLGLPDSTCAEIAAGAGFDWLLIDMEHAPFEVRSAFSHLQAISAYPTSAIVRPLYGERNILKQLLDIGVQTFLVPNVDTPEQAEELVRACRYPPEGIRGLGTSLARAANWNRIPGYLKKANKEICLIVQAESTLAIENLGAIARVEGVDAVFIGPSDLSASMGHIGDAGNPEVVEVIEQGFKTIKAAGKAAGVLAIDPALVESYIDKGASFVGVGVDSMILANATLRLAQQFCGDGPLEDEQPQAGY